MKKIILFALLLFILIGCGGGGSSSNYIIYNSTKSSNENWQDYAVVSKEIDDNSSNPTSYEINKTQKATIKLNLQSNKDVYIVTTSHFDNNDITINDSVGAASSNNYKIIPKNKAVLKTPQSVIDFRQNAHKFFQKAKKEQLLKISPSYKSYSIEEEETFCVDADNNSNNCTKEVNATVRAIVDANTSFGTRELIVWVENSEYNNTITQDMVDRFANTFLQEGSDNDIYDWVTNLFGKEWGSHNYSNLIGFDGKIHILIYKMESSTTAGYFHPKDNYFKTSIPASNEKIMFYINSTLLSGNASGYEGEKGEKETYSTLSHEFQHMIHFYQRDVLKNINDTTWFNEMLSEATEDIIATKINYEGPRNVDPNDGSAGDPGNDGGRYPYFNSSNYYSLTLWSNDIYHYALVSSFGAFLLRNYGGAKLLSDLEKSNKADINALEEVTSKTLHTLINEWGIAVILSDQTSLPSNLPQMNFGDFKLTTLNNITYKLGSINFFNYTPQPYMSNDKTINSNANLYYEAGENLDGTVLINVDFSKGGDVIVVTK